MPKSISAPSGTISVRVCAKALGYSPAIVNRQLAKGEFPFPSVRVGRSFKISRKPVEDFLGFAIADA
jgi:hypothetical protein